MNYLEETNNHQYTIQNLPPEVLYQIFSYVDAPQDQKSTSQVNSFFNGFTIWVARQEQLEKMNPLIQLLMKNLDGILHSQEIASINELKTTSSSNAVNLSKIQLLPKEMTKALAQIAKNMGDEGLQKLRNSSEESTLSRGDLKNFIVLAKLYALWDKANSFQDENEQSKIFEKISSQFLKRGYVDEAKKIANSIPNSQAEVKSSIFCDIIVAFLKQDKTNEAKELITCIPLECGLQRAYGLAGISSVLLDRGRIDEAIEVAYSIPDAQYEAKSAILHAIFTVLLKQGRLDEVKEVAYSFPTERGLRHEQLSALEHQARALLNIVDALLDQDRIEEAKKVAHSMPSVYDRTMHSYSAPNKGRMNACALLRIFRKLLRQDRSAEAKEVAHFIFAIYDLGKKLSKDSDEMYQDARWTTYLLEDFIKTFLSKGKTDEAKELVDSSHNIQDSTRADYLANIIEVLLQQGKIDAAKELVHQIPVPERKRKAKLLSYYFSRTAKGLRKEGKTDEAKKTASFAPLHEWQKE